MPRRNEEYLCGSFDQAAARGQPGSSLGQLKDIHTVNIVPKVLWSLEPDWNPPRLGGNECNLVRRVRSHGMSGMSR
jgi:hypothetical protein